MSIDLSIILGLTGAYFGLVLAAIMWSRFRSTGTIIPGLDEYFLAGRNIHVVILTCTFIGSLFSASFALALPTFVFKHGLGGGLFVIGGDMIGVLFMVTLYKSLRRFSLEHKIFSPIECLSVAYNNRWLGFLCALMMMFFLSPYISIQLVGMGKFLEGLSDGAIGYVGGVGGMMIVVALYLIFGGMRAVAYTDFIQTIAIFLGVFGSLAFFISINWDGLTGLMQDVMEKSPEHLSLPGPQDYYNLPTFFSISIISMALFFQPHLLTRAMMAKDDKQINIMAIGLFLGLVIGMLSVFLFGLGGAMLYTGTVEPNQVMGHIFKTIYSHSMLGLLMTGLMLVGALGAAMSTADSLLLAIGQIFTRDVARPFINISQDRQVLLSKIVMMVVLAGAFVMGLNPPKLMGDLVVYSASATCILLPIFIGFQWKKRSAAAAFIALGTGVATLSILGMTGTKILGLHEGFVTLIVTSTVFWCAGQLFHRNNAISTSPA